MNREILVLSARDRDSLLLQAESLHRQLRENVLGDDALADICYTLQIGRDPMEYRLAFPVSSVQELIRTLEAFCAGAPAQAVIGEGAPKTQAADAAGLNDDEIAKKWAETGNIDWRRLHADDPRQRRIVSLPSHAFEKTYTAVIPNGHGAAETLLYEEAWEPATMQPALSHPDGETVLCIAPRQAEQGFLQAFEKENIRLILASPDETDQSTDGDHETFFASYDGYTQLFSRIKQNASSVYGVVCLLNPADFPGESLFEQAAGLLRGLAKSGLHAKRVLVASCFDGTQERCAGESLAALPRAVSLLLPDVTVRTVCIQGETHEARCQMIARELFCADTENVLYENGARKHTALKERAMEEKANPSLRAGGVYLITGGMGGIGRHIASWLLRAYHATVVLLGRRAPEMVKEKLTPLHQLGGTVRYFACDVCDDASLEDALAKAEAACGSIDGIFHAAGLEGKKNILEATREEFLQVLAPKYQGTLNLIRAAEKRGTVFLFLCSSSAVMLGDFGNCAYSLGNRFQMLNALYGNGRVRAINWPLWADGGMGQGDENFTRMYLKSSGQKALTGEHAMRILERFLNSPHRQLLVMIGDRGRIERFLNAKPEKEKEKEKTVQNVQKETAAVKPQDTPVPFGASIEENVLEELKDATNRILQLPKEDMGEDENLADFGYDSILLTEFANTLTERLGIRITPDVFFSHPTLGRLKTFLCENHREALEKRYHQTPGNAPAAKEAKASSQGVLSAPKERIAIVGFSGRFPGADTPEALWQVLSEGRETVGNVPPLRPHWRTGPRKGSGEDRMGFLPQISQFDSLFFGISPSEAESMDPQQRIILEETWKALEHAGYGQHLLDEERVGVFVGAEDSDYKRLLSGDEGITSNNTSLLSARIAYQLNLRGPNLTMNTACSSGLTAFHQAMLSLESGECDSAIVAGVSVACTSYAYDAMEASGMLAPDRVCRAFDRKASGMVPAEAAAVLVLKKEGKARRDGHRIYGCVLGTGINYDGRTNGITAPNGDSQKELFLSVYDRCQIKAEEIGLVMAHGTGTRLGDPIELNALADALRKDTKKRNFCCITSTKSNLGHSLAASGLVSMIALLLAMREGKLPPQINCDEPSDYISWEDSPLYLNKKLCGWALNGRGVRVGAVSALGMSGTNAHAVLESAPQETEKKTAHVAELLLLSAKTPEALEEQCSRMADALEKLQDSDLANAAFTLAEGRMHFKYRCAAVVSNREEAIRALRTKEMRIEGQLSKTKKLSAAKREAYERLQRSARQEETFVRCRESLASLGQAFCEGFEIDGRVLDPECARIPLPSYPFEPTECWAKGRSKEGFELKNLSDLQKVEYEAELSANAFYFRDHVILGNPVLPGVCVLELVSRAAREAFEPKENEILRLSNVGWLNPIRGPKDGLLRVRVSFEVSGGQQAAFTVRASEGEPAVVYCQGLAEFTQAGQQEKLDPEKMRKQAVREIAGETCYETYSGRGMAYGPAFRYLKRVYALKDAVLSELKLQDNTPSEGFTLIPGMADGALQGLVSFSDGEEKARVPFAMDRVEIFAPCEAKMWAVGRKGGGRAEKYDVLLLGEQGNICVKFVGYTAIEASGKMDPKVVLVREEQPAPLFKADGAAEKERTDLFIGMPAISQSIPFDLNDPAALFLQVSDQVREMISRGYKKNPHIQAVVPQEGAARLLGALEGLFRAAERENPRFFGKVIEMPAQTTAEEARCVLDAEAPDRSAHHVAYRSGQRFAEVFRRTRLPGKASFPWKDGAVYLITGGTGGLGSMLAREIAEKVRSTVLVLSGQRPQDERIEALIREIGGSGNRAVYLQMDVTDAEAVRISVAGIAEKYGRLDGIVHCAGINRDRYLIQKPREEFLSVLEPKVCGLKNLDEASKHLNLDFLIAFASITGVMGNAGQTDYATANAFMDRYMIRRAEMVQNGERRGLSLSIAWPLWKDGGMRVSAGDEKMLLETYGTVPMPTEEGLKLLYGVWQLSREQNVPGAACLYGEGAPFEKLVAELTAGADAARAADTAPMESHEPAPADEPVFPDQEPSAESRDDWTEQTLRVLKKTVSEVLKVSEKRIDPDAEMDEYGLNSITVLDLIRELEKIFGSLPKTLFYEFETLREMADALQEKYPRPKEKKQEPEAAQKARPAARQARTPLSASEMPSLRNSVPPQSPSSPPEEAVAVIGLSGAYPMADNLEIFWENLKAGRDCIEAIPWERFDAEAWKNRMGENAVFPTEGGFIHDAEMFDPLFFHISPREAERTDPQERLMLTHAYWALEDAGYTRDQLAKAGRTGVIVGAMYSEYQYYGVEEQNKGNMVAYTGTYASLANRISYCFNLHGPSLAVDSMCSSALSAIWLACRELSGGSCDMMIVGGVNLSLHPNKFVMLAQGHFAASNGRCMSFGEGGDGYAPAEGVGAAILKPLSKAIRDGDHIYGVIRAAEANHGGKTTGYTVPNPRAQADAAIRAMKRAGIRADTINYVEAHGTGTALGDPIEVNSLTAAWRNDTNRTGICYLGSVKSNIGHCEAAAGMAALSKVLLQMKHRQLVPSIHSEKLNPYIRFEETPFIVNRELRPWEPVTAEENGVKRALPLRAGIESFGAGGSNVHLIVEEYKQSPRQYAGPFCLPFSARTEEQLLRLAEEMYDRTVRGGYTDDDLPSIAWTLQNSREAMEYRLGISAGSVEEVRQKLSSFLYGDRAQSDVHYGRVREKENERDQLFAEEESAIMSRWVAEGRLEKVLEGFVRGISVEWEGFWPNEHPLRISLPLYPFANTRCWFDTPERELSYMREEWVKAESVPDFALPKGRSVLWLVHDEAEAAAAGKLSRKNGAVLLCGDRNETLDAGRLSVDTRSSEALTAGLRAALEAGVSKPDDVIFCLPSGQAAKPCFTETARLFKALIANGLEPKTLVLAGRYTDEESRCAVDALYGFVQSARSLLQETKVCLLGGPKDELTEDKLFQQCLNILHPKAPNVLMLMDGSWKTNQLSEFHPVRKQSALRRSGTYLITGGLGGIGLIVADWLLRCFHANVVLTGRGINDTKQKKLDALHDRYGNRVCFVQADVCDPDAMRDAVKTAKDAYGALHGVFHCAGVEGTRKLTEADEKTFERTLLPKVTGTQVLMQALENEKTELICFFSSTSALLGDFGDCAYSTGNRYMMKLAETMARPDRTVRTVNWPLWRNGGMGSDDRDAVSMYLRSSGLRLLENKEALEALDLICAQDEPQTAVFARAVRQANRLEKAKADRAGSPQAQPAPVKKAAAAAEGLDERKALMELLKSDVCALMKIDEEQVGYDVLLADYGFDSITLAEFASLLHRQTGIKVVPDMFFSFPTILKLGDRLLEMDRGTVRAHLFAKPLAEEAPQTETLDASPEKAAEPVLSHAARTVRKSVDEPIAVIGVSGRFPGADSPDELWRLLREGKTSVDEVPAERPLWHEDGKKRRMGSLDRVYDFDPMFFEIPPSEADAMDPRQRLLLEEAWKALEMAGLGPALPDFEETGVFVGAEDSTYGIVTDYAGGVTANHNAMLAARLAYFLDMKGPNMTLNTACSSGLAAVHEACLSIRSGECDTAVAAGVNLLFTPRSYDMMESAGMLSPTQTCRAFDRGANGMVPGEGVAAVVLKRLSLAQRDQHTILAVITGSGLNYDGRTNGITAPGIPSQVRLLTNVYDRFGIRPEEIGYVLAHGTGTKLGDPMELKALTQAFRRYTDKRLYCAVGSIKPNIGHGLAVSGVSSLIAMVEALRSATIPPQINFAEGSDAIEWEDSPFFVTTDARPWENGQNGKRTGAVSAFGMGGTNVHVVIENAPETETAEEIAPRPVLLPVSARSQEALEKMLHRLADALENGQYRLCDASFTLLEGRRHFRCRSCVTATTIEEAVQMLRDAEKANVSRKFLRDSSVEQEIEAMERRYADEEDTAAMQEALQTLAARYLEGYTLSGGRLFAHLPVRRIPLPPYAFDNQTYRMDPAETAAEKVAMDEPMPEEQTEESQETETERETITLAIGIADPPADAIVLEAEGEDSVREKLERILELLTAPETQEAAELRILIPAKDAPAYAFIDCLMDAAGKKKPGFIGRIVII